MRFLLPILVCVGLAAESVASDYRFEDLPVGNRAMILGGAFTALSNDPSGVYYNPAGLVDTSRANVSISASLYGMGQKRIEASEESSSQFRIIPGAIGGMYTFDWKQGKGRSPYACALSVLSPSAVQNESLTIQEERLQQGFRVSDETSTTFRSQTETNLWAGVGCAMALADDYSLGFSLFAVHRASQYTRQDIWILNTVDRLGQFFDESEPVSNYYQSVSTLDTSDQALVLKLGGKARFGSLLLGLRLRLPSLALHSDGQARNSLFTSTIGDIPAQAVEDFVNREQDPDALQIKTVYPGGIRIGAAWVAHKSFTLSCDVNADLPVEYERIAFREETVRNWFRLPKTVKRDLNINGACGAEFLVDTSMSVALGAFAHTSAMSASLQNIDPETFAFDGEREDSDVYGVTLSLGSFGEHSLSRFGITFTGANGRILSYNTWENTWSVFDTYEWAAFFFLASTFRY